MNRRRFLMLLGATAATPAAVAHALRRPEPETATEVCILKKRTVPLTYDASVEAHMRHYERYRENERHYLGEEIRRKWDQAERSLQAEIDRQLTGM